MPTIAQLVRKGREHKTVKAKTPVLRDREQARSHHGAPRDQAQKD